MKISELIQKLQKYDLNSNVRIADSNIFSSNSIHIAAYNDLIFLSCYGLDEKQLKTEFGKNVFDNISVKDKELTEEEKEVFVPFKYFTRLHDTFKLPSKEEI